LLKDKSNRLERGRVGTLTGLEKLRSEKEGEKDVLVITGLGKYVTMTER